MYTRQLILIIVLLGSIIGMTASEVSASDTLRPNAIIQINVNYTYDIISGQTDFDAVVTITVKDAADRLKDTAVITADNTGFFVTKDEHWGGGFHPDILPGDKVYAFVPGGQTEVNPVGLITVQGNANKDTVTGELNVTGLGPTTTIHCLM